MIEIEPDPIIPAAQQLAAKISARQAQVRVSNGVGYSVNSTRPEESEWLAKYRQAEIRMNREHRAAEREARRAARRTP